MWFRFAIVIISALVSLSSSASVEFLNLFKNKKPAIAAIMVDGQINAPEEFQKNQNWVIEQAKIAENGGMDGFLLEFRGGDILDKDISSQQLEQMVDLTKKLISSTSLVVGVEILWHFPGSTLLLAKNSGAKFVRIDFFSDRVVANKMEVPIDPQSLLAYRKKIGAESVALLTDIQVKYSKMINPQITIGESAMTAQSSGSDGVIVSGSESGTSPKADKLKKTKSARLKIPVIIGSGFSSENAPELLPYLDAVIVGTSISQKTGGPLLSEKVVQLMEKVKKSRAL